MTRKIKRPICIIGCNNSGTTILRDALLKHPHLSGPEIDSQELEGMPRIMTHFLGDCTSRLWMHPKFKLCLHVTEQDYKQEDQAQMIEVLAPFIQSGTRLIIKSPGDTIRVRLIQAFFPDTFFIAVVRNGYAVSEGTIRKRKYDPDRPQLPEMFTSIEEAAEHWFRVNVMVLSNQTFLRNYLIVKYEDLVQDPQKVLHHVLNFCELETDGFSVPKFDTDRNTKKIFSLSEYEREVVTRIAGPMLIHFGYKLFSKELRWQGLDSG